MDDSDFVELRTELPTESRWFYFAVCVSSAYQPSEGPRKIQLDMVNISSRQSCYWGPLVWDTNAQTNCWQPCAERAKWWRTSHERAEEALQRQCATPPKEGLWTMSFTHTFTSPTVAQAAEVR